MTDKLLKYLDEIKARHEAATPEIWRWDKARSDGGSPQIRAYGWPGRDRSICRVDFDGGSEDPQVHNNARFIAGARTDIPKMERRLRAMQRVIEAWVELRKAQKDQGVKSIRVLAEYQAEVMGAESTLAELIEKEWA